MQTFQNFTGHPNQMEYKTQKIGDGLDHPENIDRATFRSVSDFIDVIYNIKFRM